MERGIKEDNKKRFFDSQELIHGVGDCNIYGGGGSRFAHVSMPLDDDNYY